MNVVKAVTAKRIKARGDLMVAQEATEIFNRAGGVEKVMEYIKDNYGGLRKKNKAAAAKSRL
jgi:hypothetical protein